MLCVAGKDLVRDRKAFAADREPHHDLLAIGSMVGGMAAQRLGIARALALEVGRGEVVQIDRRIEVEQAALAREQRRLDG